MIMLIKSSLSNSLSTEPSFVSDLRKQQNPEQLCDCPNCAGSPNDKFPLDNCRKTIPGVAEISRSSSDKPVKEMCTNFASKWNGFVYKRRRLRRNTHSPLSQENAIDLDEGNNGLNSSIASAGTHLKFPIEQCSHTHTSCSSSKSFIGQDSARDFCISILKRHGLLVGTNNNTTASLKVLAVKDVNISTSCKICSFLGNPLKMVICDLCEDAFHMSCCQPKRKNPPIDYWICQPCLTKKPSGKLANYLSHHLYRKFHHKESPISRMLRDDQPYTSDVRIGKRFQVDIPQWSGPISEEGNYFNEHLELDLVDCTGLNDQRAKKPTQSSSFSNWIQCREVIYKNRKDKGTICGKWRRAPLFVVQTDYWGCSCSVLWDPIHADCSVPQELETDVILEHLKYFEMLRPKLNISKQIPQGETDSLQ